LSFVIHDSRVNWLFVHTKWFTRSDCEELKLNPFETELRNIEFYVNISSRFN